MIHFILARKVYEFYFWQYFTSELVLKWSVSFVKNSIKFYQKFFFSEIFFSLDQDLNLYKVWFCESVTQSYSISTNNDAWFPWFNSL